MAENGTTVHAVAKVLQKHARIGTYVWARDLDEIKQWVLTQGSVVVGTDWHTGQFYPDATGLVRPTGQVEGGHAYLIVGYDTATDMFKFQNSWGAGWGQNGYFYMKAGEWGGLFDSNAEAMATTELPLAALRQEATWPLE